MSRFSCIATHVWWVIPLGPMLAGCTNVLGFGTATKFGLDIAQQADQTIDVSMGYDRVEIASIPAPKNEVATAGTDKAMGADTYSVLGTFNVSYGNPWDEQPLVLHQVFATGWAAREAAKIPEMRAYFGKEAGDIAARKGVDDQPHRSGSQQEGAKR